MNTFSVILASSVIATSNLLAHEAVNPAAGSPSGGSINVGRPDGHAPIGVMGDHVHRSGEWMFAYRYMHMDMQRNYQGDSQISDQNVLRQGFLVAPTDMTMDMQMFSVMYAVTDEATLMFGLPYLEKRMNHVIGGPPPFPLRGSTFHTESKGIGDSKLTLLYQVWEGARQNLILNAGLSMPTGSIDKEDVLPLPPPASYQVLPYPMQLGSGSVGLIPGVTYNGQADWISWGAQARGTIWVNDNNEDYRLGDTFIGTAWIAAPWTDWLSTSVRLSYQWWGDIDGADPRIARVAPIPGFRTVPTAQPGLRGGERLDALLGLNIDFPIPSAWPIGSLRIAVEGGMPAWQNLKGPQLGVDWLVTTGLQVSW